MTIKYKFPNLLISSKKINKKILQELKQVLLRQSVFINFRTDTIYVTNAGSDSVSVINGSTNKLITNIQAGITPVSLDTNPVTNKVYVANYGDNSISVIDGSINKIVARYPLGFTPVAIAINPVTNKIYVANYGDNSISVIDGSINKIQFNIKSLNNPIDIAINKESNTRTAGSVTRPSARTTTSTCSPAAAGNRSANRSCAARESEPRAV